MAADSGTAFELLSLPFQGGGQAQIIQSSGSELEGDSSQGDNHLVHQSNGRVHFGPQLRLSLSGLATDQCEIHLNRRTGLAEFVMDLSSDGGAFLFPHTLETRRKGAELIEGRSELFLRTLALSNFGSQFLVNS